MSIFDRFTSSGSGNPKLDRVRKAITRAEKEAEVRGARAREAYRQLAAHKNRTTRERDHIGTRERLRKAETEAQEAASTARAQLAALRDIQRLMSEGGDDPGDEVASDAELLRLRANVDLAGDILNAVEKRAEAQRRANLSAVGSAQERHPTRAPKELAAAMEAADARAAAAAAAYGRAIDAVVSALVGEREGLSRREHIEAIARRAGIEDVLA